MGDFSVIWRRMPEGSNAYASQATSTCVGIHPKQPHATQKVSKVSVAQPNGIHHNQIDYILVKTRSEVERSQVQMWM